MNAAFKKAFFCFKQLCVQSQLWGGGGANQALEKGQPWGYIAKQAAGSFVTLIDTQGGGGQEDRKKGQLGLCFNW